MNRRTFVASLGTATAATLAGCASQTASVSEAARRAPGAPAPQRPPNIVFIFIDDQSPAQLGCYGGRTPTPHIDRLAREGALFRACYSNTPLCNPSRYTVLTGQYANRNARMRSHTLPGEHHRVHQDTRLLESQHSIGSLLQAAGYRTGIIGKWHSNFEIARAGLPPFPAYPKPEQIDSHEGDAILRTRQEIMSQFIRRIGHFDHASHLQWGNVSGKTVAEHHCPEWMTDGALDYIETSHREGRPFFLHFACTLPHAPRPTGLLDIDPRYTQGGRLADVPKSHPSRQAVADRLRAAGLPVSAQAFGTAVIDDQVGAILAKLEALGIADDTLIVLAQDNGNVGKGSCYRSGLHSALLMRWPARIRAGTVVEHDVTFVDFVPTFLAAARANPPADYRPDGVDLLPVIDRHAPPARDGIYSECGLARSLIQGRWHYIAFRYRPSDIAAMQAADSSLAPDTWGETKANDNHTLLPYKPAFFEPDQLYDMLSDPLERTNLAADSAHAARLARMKASLFAQLDHLGDPVPRDPAPFIRTFRFEELAKARRDSAASLSPWPNYPHEDWEKHLNYDLKSPEEVDPEHPGARRRARGTEG